MLFGALCRGGGGAIWQTLSNRSWGTKAVAGKSVSSNRQKNSRQTMGRTSCILVEGGGRDLLEHRGGWGVKGVWVLVLVLDNARPVAPRHSRRFGLRPGGVDGWCRSG